MVARINTVAFNGVDVQVQISNGLPAFTIVGPINPDIKLFLKTVVFILVSTIVLLCSLHSAYALSCSKESYSLEDAFIGADTVFSGTLIKNNEDGSASLAVNEYFKSSDLESEPKEVKVFNVPNSKTSLPEDAEFIIYGDYKNKNPNEVAFSVCGKSKLSADTVQHWAAEKEKHRDKLESFGKILFVGKVLESKHTSIERNKEIRSKSEIHTQIQHVLFNQSGDFKLEENGSIGFYIALCGEEMKVGHEYIVSAEPGKLRAENGARLNPPRDILNGYCTNMFPMDMDEKAILRKLSKLSKQ